MQRRCRKCASFQNILSLCNGDAEDAHLKTIVSLPLPSGGGVEGENILFREQKIIQKVIVDLPPFHLRESVGREGST